MKRTAVLPLLSSLALMIALGIAVRNPRVPLGVPGEWVWPRLGAAGPNLHDLAWACLASLVYTAFCVAGMRDLGRNAGRWREVGWLAGLAGAAIAVQYAAVGGAPEAFGEEKVAFVLAERGPSGYYNVAVHQVRDPWGFWSSYPDWARKQDELHIGTHPPGLVLANIAALHYFRARPQLARAIVEASPPRVAWGFKGLKSRSGDVSLADRAALTVIAGLTLLAGALTVVPLYVLARTEVSSTAAWAAATLWPLGTSAVMFLPTSDLLWPILSTSAIALAARGRFVSAVLAGVLLALGMAFTLAFLPVGLVVALVLASDRTLTRKGRASRIVATGLGFLIPTLATWPASGANPFAIWIVNLANHGRFYVTYPRSYVPWVFANAADLAVGLGLPLAVWAALGFTNRSAPRASWATLAVLVLLELSGRNLGEVARLWLPLMPPLYAAAGAGLVRSSGGPLILGVSLFLMATQLLALQATIQVAYVWSV